VVKCGLLVAAARGKWKHRHTETHQGDGLRGRFPWRACTLFPVRWDGRCCSAETPFHPNTPPRAKYPANSPRYTPAAAALLIAIASEKAT